MHQSEVVYPMTSPMMAAVMVMTVQPRLVIRSRLAVGRVLPLAEIAA